MIKSIRLINWRSHADTFLEFRAGTNLLIGIMGAGKSSILEAISFAFFGTFPALDRRKVKLEDIVRLNEPHASVALTFDWNNITYSVSRKIERSKKGAFASAELYKDSSLLESGSVAVTEYIQNLTGVNYDLFTRAIYSEQNNLDYFLNLDPRRRKQEIDALLGLDRFEEARANTVSVIGRLKSKKEGFEMRFERSKLEAARKDLLDWQAKRDEFEKSLKEIDTKLQAEQKTHALSDSDFKRMDSLRQQHETLSKESIRLHALQESLANETKGFEEARHNESKALLARLLEERQKMHSESKTIETEIARVSKEIGGIDERIKSSHENQKKLKDLQSELESLLKGKTKDHIIGEQKDCEKKVLDSDSERKMLEHEIQEITELSTKLKPKSGRCPLCHSQLTEESASHIHAEKAEELKARQERLRGVCARLLEHKKMLAAIAMSANRISLLSSRIEPLAHDLSAVDPAALGEKKSTMLAELGNRNTAKTGLDRKSEIISESIEKAKIESSRHENLLLKKKELESVSKRTIETDARLSSIRFEPSIFESVRSRLESSKLTVQKLISQHQGVETELKNAQNLIKILKDTVESSERLEKDIAHLAKLEEELSIYKNALLSTQISLRLSLVDAINGAMNDIWPIFYPYRNYSSLRFSVSDKDYVFEVDEHGRWKSLESTASGGERASAALTLRVALAMVLTPQLSWLILDEPTHNLDKDAICLLSDALQTKIPQVVKQAFIITHEEGLMGSEFASSYRLTRDKSRNGETKTEAI